MKRESFLQVKWESVSQVEEILQLPFVSIQFPFSVSAEVWVIDPPPPPPLDSCSAPIPTTPTSLLFWGHFEESQ